MWNFFSGLFIILGFYLLEFNGFSLAEQSFKFLEEDDKRNILKLNDAELAGFYSSFGNVIIDINGIVIEDSKFIPGALDVLRKLQNKGKKIIILTNNSIFPREYYVELFKFTDVSISPENIELPSSALIWYLQNKNFTSAYVLGPWHLKEALKEKDISTISGPNSVEENISELENNVRATIDRNVDVVVFDFDVNINWIKMMQVLMLINKKKPVFVNDGDFMMRITSKSPVLSHAPFARMFNHLSNISTTSYAKGSVLLENYLRAKYNINNKQETERWLLIGYELQDMMFAHNCNFMSLLVKSKFSKFNESHMESWGVNYYLPNLGVMPVPDDTLDPIVISGR